MVNNISGMNCLGDKWFLSEAFYGMNYDNSYTNMKNMITILLYKSVLSERIIFYNKDTIQSHHRAVNIVGCWKCILLLRSPDCREYFAKVSFLLFNFQLFYSKRLFCMIWILPLFSSLFNILEQGQWTSSSY